MGRMPRSADRHVGAEKRLQGNDLLMPLRLEAEPAARVEIQHVLKFLAGFVKWLTFLRTDS